MSRLRALWLLARPPMIPYIWLLILAGFGWAHWDRALTLRGGQELLLVLVAWLLLHAGTLWLNAAADRDEGEILFGRPVPVPPGVEWDAGLALLGTVVLGVAAGVGAAAVVCAVLAVAYSHPRTMWKGHPVLGPLTNWVGYGLLYPWAGWAVVDVSLNPRTGVAWLLASVGVLGVYFAAQVFQEEEDRARGYGTLVATHGAAVALTAARVCVLFGFIGGMALAALGWLPRLCLLGAPLGLWIDQWMRRAAVPGNEVGSAWARGFTSRLLVTGLVGLALALGAYVRDDMAGRPVAGLGTAAGHPSDRPRLPPAAMAVWEARQAAEAP